MNLIEGMQNWEWMIIRAGKWLIDNLDRDWFQFRSEQRGEAQSIQLIFCICYLLLTGDRTNFFHLALTSHSQIQTINNELTANELGIGGDILDIQSTAIQAGQKLNFLF